MTKVVGDIVRAELLQLVYFYHFSCLTTAQ